jgi:adenylyltransferase/sulfurtransferase
VLDEDLVSMREITVDELARRMAAGEPTYLVDVRQPWEHQLVALAGSVLVPLGELADLIDEVTPPEGALVVAYCHHGVRSLSAVAILEQAGISAVSLAGGIDAWSREIDPDLPRY